MTLTVKDILIEARAKIDTPEKWTKGVLARHDNGNPIGPQEANAKCWCLQGAIMATKTTDRLECLANDALARQLPSGFRTTHRFNDHMDTKHEDVLALFDRAIAAQPI